MASFSPGEFAEFNALLASAAERKLPLAPVLGLLAEQAARPRLRAALESVQWGLKDGMPLPAALKAVPPSIREAALGMGASQIQMVAHHVLPLAMPGMLTGTIIGMARALGESAPLLMIGMVAFIVDVPKSLFDPATVLPVQVFIWSDVPERAFVERTSGAIIVLLAFLVFRYFLAVFTVAGCVALLVQPFHRRLRAAMGGRRNLAAGLLVLITTLLILLPIVISVLLLSEQAVQFFDWLRPRLQPDALRELWRETLPQRLPFLQGYLRFDPTSVPQPVPELSPLRVSATIQHPEHGDPWEYSVVLTVRNEKGEEISRQVVGVGALQPTERRTFNLAVEVFKPDSNRKP